MGMFDQPMEVMSTYDQLGRVNLIRKLAPMFKDGRLAIKAATGKIRLGERMLYLESPWLTSGITSKHKCDLWLNMMNDKCLHFIPSECRSCWKVVVRPKTLKQLFQLYAYQQSCGFACKCGIEVRTYVRGSYGGYFYTSSYEECGERYLEVREAMDKIDHEMTVIMKRSCTEYEHGFGDSSKYIRPADADTWEKLMLEWIDYKNPGCADPDYFKANVKQSWIEFAWNRNDPSVDEFTGGRQLFPPVHTYHEDFVKGQSEQDA